MTKAAFLLIFTLHFFIAGSQGFLLVKKGNKTLQSFYQGSLITFQLKTGDWISGHITRLLPDSLYVRPISIRRSLFTVDTVHFSELKIAMTDISVLPRKTAMVYYRDDKPQLVRGHEKFAYIKNGLVFQLLGGGYAALNIINSVTDKKSPDLKRVGIGALVFLVGEVLRRNYHQHLHLGKKYQLRFVKL